MPICKVERADQYADQYSDQYSDHFTDMYAARVEDGRKRKRADTYTDTYTYTDTDTYTDTCATDSGLYASRRGDGRKTEGSGQYSEVYAGGAEGRPPRPGEGGGELYGACPAQPPVAPPSGQHQGRGGGLYSGQLSQHEPGRGVPVYNDEHSEHEPGRSVPVYNDEPVAGRGVPVYNDEPVAGRGVPVYTDEHSEHEPGRGVPVCNDEPVAGRGMPVCNDEPVAGRGVPAYSGEHSERMADRAVAERQQTASSASRPVPYIQVRVGDLGFLLSPHYLTPHPLLHAVSAPTDCFTVRFITYFIQTDFFTVWSSLIHTIHPDCFTV